MLLLAAGATFWAGAACARPAPPPPPSGIVVHLFGPNAALANVLPTTSGPSGAPAAPLTMPDILNQMFVTGNPDLKPGQSFAKGRAGN
jgi:hypothetical protein